MISRYASNNKDASNNKKAGRDESNSSNANNTKEATVAGRPATVGISGYKIKGCQ
jgi:hypothetical protein